MNKSVLHTPVSSNVSYSALLGLLLLIGFSIVIPALNAVQAVPTVYMQLSASDTADKNINGIRDSLEAMKPTGSRQHTAVNITDPDELAMFTEGEV
jgi:hypothetical protein